MKVILLKPPSFTNNSVDSRTAAASHMVHMVHMGHNSSAHVARNGRLRFDAFICSWKTLKLVQESELSDWTKSTHDRIYEDSKISEKNKFSFYRLENASHWISTIASKFRRKNIRTTRIYNVIPMVKSVGNYNLSKWIGVHAKGLGR